MSKKELANIEPFDDIFFRWCLYNPLLSVLKYFKKNVMSYIVNDINLYKIDESKLKNEVVFSVKNIQVKDDNELLKDMGLEAEYKMNTNDIVKTAIESINDEIPIIIYADAFFCEHYKLFYNNDHHWHFMFIFGYDEESKIFKIIDVNNEDTTIKRISFETLRKAYKGFNDFLKDDIKHIDYIQIKPIKNYVEISDNGVNNYVNLFKKNMLDNKDIIVKNVESIIKIEENLRTILLSESVLDDNINKLLESFFFIIVIKKTERYRITKLFGENCYLIDPLNKIVKLWEKVKLKVVKCQLTKDINTEIISQNVMSIYKLEKYYVKELFNYIENN